MILKNAKIILEDKIINVGWIELEGNKIKSINVGLYRKDGIDLKNNIIMPGFIDCHVHGGYGVDFEDATLDSFTHFAENVVKEGITRYCQATVTQPDEVIEKSLEVYKEWMLRRNKGPQQARQIGAHLEGPFVSKEKKGAHSLELLKNTNNELVKKWIKISQNNIKLITYAIENDKSNFAHFLKSNNIIPSVGHSNVSAEEYLEKGVKKGSYHVTHLFNGMSGISHFTKGGGTPSGIANGALINDEVLCEVIADGVHLNNEVLDLTYRVKGPNGICLITDAMRAKGMKDGPYKLGPLDVVKKGSECRLKGSTLLAGSVATFDHCFRNFKKVTKAGYQEMAKVSSINIAKQLNIFDKTGSIEVGKLADLTVLSPKNEVVMTIVEGVVSYKK